jgi:putative heme-binding domain-containing protein
MRLHCSAWMITALLIGLPALAQRAAAPAGPPNPYAGDDESIEEGHQIFNRSCTACHGLDGGVGDRAPALAATRRYQRNTDAQLFDAIRHGIPGTAMPAVPLQEADAWKVAAYITSLRATAIATPVKGDIAHGEQLFWNKGQCGSCHMLNGKGGLVGPDLSNIAAQRKLSAIQDALTKPKPHPSPGFVPVRVMDKQGKAISGILKNEHNFSLQVLGSDNVIHLFDRTEIRDVVYEPASLMPSDYDRRLSGEELRDLIAFLCRQARQEGRRPR